MFLLKKTNLSVLHRRRRKGRLFHKGLNNLPDCEMLLNIVERQQQGISNHIDFYVVDFYIVLPQLFLHSSSYQYFTLPKTIQGK